MIILNEGKTTEVTLRVALESDVYGREYFDRSDDLRELLETVESLVKDGSEACGKDGIERAVTVAIIPKANYGDQCGYGFDL